jgi:hypothetical protein
MLRDCRGESSRVNWLADVGQVDRDDSHGLLVQGDYQAHSLSILNASSTSVACGNFPGLCTTSQIVLYGY